jgi:hypothetical protein
LVSHVWPVLVRSDHGPDYIREAPLHKMALGVATS